MKTLLFLLGVWAVLFLGGCSSKKVFEPKETAGDWERYAELDEAIEDISYNAALLENKKVLAKNNSYDVVIEENYRVLGVSGGWILSADIDGNLTMDANDASGKQERFSLKKTVAGASVEGDVLAVLFADNEIALYSVATKEVLFKEQGNPPIIIDARIVNPQFMNDLALFLTLDGKVIIVNTQLKKKLRTVIVSTQEHFNNIIYFAIVDNKLIAATAHKLFSLGEKEIRVNHEVRTITNDAKNIYIATKQGEVMVLGPTLDVHAKIKFPFAHFLGMIVQGEKLYLLEKEGYLIEAAKDLQEYAIYEADVEEALVFVGEESFYSDDTSILLK
ncbi:MAG: hypothetical protein AB7D43_08470 [Sulfurimonadaceae bacterium]